MISALAVESHPVSHGQKTELEIRHLCDEFGKHAMRRVDHGPHHFGFHGIALHCSMCHGADGKGFAVMKTPDMTDPKWQETHSDETISEFIRTGKAPMPAFPADKISDEELKAIIAHIRTLKKKATSEE